MMNKGEEEKDEQTIISSANLAPPSSSLNDGSNPFAMNTKSEDPHNKPNHMDDDGSCKNASPRNAGKKAKSCKGCLYYSSNLKNDSRNPLCVGLTHTLPNVPRYLVGQSETEESKQVRNLTDFRYACVGYSLYMDRKEQVSNGQELHRELPFCAGLEVLVDRQPNTTDSASAPMPHHNREDRNGLPQRRSPKPSNSTGEEFFSRFTHNANLVANGVVKNIRKVGNQIKQCLDDILFKRPK